jgi:hypothetical protein
MVVQSPEFKLLADSQNPDRAGFIGPNQVSRIARHSG